MSTHGSNLRNLLRLRYLSLLLLLLLLLLPRLHSLLWLLLGIHLLVQVGQTVLPYTGLPHSRKLEVWVVIQDHLGPRVWSGVGLGPSVVLVGRRHRCTLLLPVRIEILRVDIHRIVRGAHGVPLGHGIWIFVSIGGLRVGRCRIVLGVLRLLLVVHWLHVCLLLGPSVVHRVHATLRNARER